MKPSFRNAWCRMIRTLSMGATVVIGLVALGLFGPRFESVFLPVLSDQRVIKVSRADDLVTFEISVRKQRDCRIAAAGWTVHDGTRFSPIIVTNAAGLPAVGVTTFERGELDLGPFTARLPPAYTDASDITAILHYDCHPGWLVRQHLGPVLLPPA